MRKARCQLHINVDQDLADRIALAMRLEERTMTEILTQAITEYLSIHNSDTTD